MHWSREYGPHLFVVAPKKAEMAPVKDGFVQPAEDLVLAASDKVKTTFLLTIPAGADKLF
jgi:hypothetical protein